MKREFLINSLAYQEHRTSRNLWLSWYFR